MSTLMQRRIGMLDYARGGWMHVYEICDGETVVASKTVTAITRHAAAVVAYTLPDGRSFASLADFIAAYVAQKAQAA